MAIVRRGRTIQSEKSLRKRRKKQIIAAVLFVIALASLAAVVYFFFQARFVQIKSVNVSGPVGIDGGALSLVPADTVQTGVQKELSGNRALFISKNTIFTYPRGEIRADILQKYPAAKTVDFESERSFLGFGNSIGLRVYITERSPFALACAQSLAPDLNDCYYIDNSGFVYAPVASVAIASTTSSENFIRYSVMPPTGQQVPALTSTSTSSSSVPTAKIPAELKPGQPFVDLQTFTGAQQIVNAVSAMGLDVVADSISFDAYGPANSIVINDPQTAISIADGAATTTTVIYFNQSEPLTTELRYFSEFWKNQATSTASQLQYVDMRYGKDIVYKVYSQSSTTKPIDNE